jgi:hypothetical protein
VPSIVSIQELLSFGGLREERVDGALLEILLDAAEDFVARYTRRHFVPEPALADDGSDTLDPVTKSFYITRGRKTLRIPDLRVATTVKLNGSALVTDIGYQIDSYGEPATSLTLVVPYGYANNAMGVYVAPLTNPYGNGVVAITGRWGWNPAPLVIKHAVLALTMRMYRERDANWSDSVALPDGSVLSYFRQLPASVQGALNLLRTPNITLV